MDTEKINQIALIAPFGWAGISAPLYSTIEYFSQKDYIVDVFLDENSFCNNLGLNKPLFDLKNVNIFFFKFNKEINYFPFKDIEVSNRNLDFIEFFKKNSNLKYEFIIGYDEEGIIRAGLCSFYFNIKYFYHSLEFYELKNKTKKAEKYFASNAEKILTQCKYRKKILSNLLTIPKNKINIVYNTSLGECLKEKNKYFHSIFNIPKNKKIVLATGALMFITGIDKILNSLKNWDNNFVLILHGTIVEKEMEDLIASVIKEHPNKVFHSKEKLMHHDKFKIFTSSDITLMYYKPINLNLKYAAWSSGKFFDSARCGTPVIANNIINMSKLVEDTGCGIVVNDFSKINNYFYKIINNYSFYRNNCFKTYLHFNFKKSFDLALEQKE